LPRGRRAISARGGVQGSAEGATSTRESPSSPCMGRLRGGGAARVWPGGAWTPGPRRLPSRRGVAGLPTPRVSRRRSGLGAAAAGGTRHCHLQVELRSPSALLVRGALVGAVDAALLAACWLLSLVLAEGWRPRMPGLVRALRTSYRVRLATTLSAFVVVPVLL